MGIDEMRPPENTVSVNEKRVTVVFSNEDFERFDAYCREHGMKKSPFIVQLVLRHMNESRFQNQQQLPLSGS